MNAQSSNAQTGTTSVGRLLLAGSIQTAVVLLVAVGLMFALRGKPAEQQIRDRWAAGGSVSGSFSNSTPPPAPVNAKWATEQAMLGEAKPVELTKQNFTYEDLQFSIELPDTAEVETPGGPEIVVKLTPEVKMNFRFGHSNLADYLKSPPTAFAQAKQFLFSSDEILVMELDQEHEQRFDFFANVTYGYLDFSVSAESDDQDYETHNSLADCLLLLKCLRTLKLESELPSDPVALIEAAGGDVQRNEQGEVIELNLHYADVGSTLMAMIAEFPQLESLQFQSHYVGSHTFAVLEQVPHLRKLVVKGGRSLNDEEMSYLVTCTELESLSISASNLNAKSLGQVGELTKLQRLSIDLIEKEAMPGLAELGNLTELEHLNLGTFGEPWPRSALTFLAKLPKLKTLLLDGQFDDSGAANVAAAKSLEELTIEDVVITDAGLLDLASLTNLTTLHLKGTDASFSNKQMTITSAGLAPLKNLDKVTSFSLEHAPLDDTAIDHLVAMPNLTSLKLSHVPITDMALTKLAAYEQLEQLSVIQCEQLTEEGVAAFKEARPNVKFTKW